MFTNSCQATSFSFQQAQPILTGGICLYCRSLLNHCFKEGMFGRVCKLKRGSERNCFSSMISCTWFSERNLSQNSALVENVDRIWQNEVVMTSKSSIVEPWKKVLGEHLRPGDVLPTAMPITWTTDRRSRPSVKVPRLLLLSPVEKINQNDAITERRWSMYYLQRKEIILVDISFEVMYLVLDV